MVLKEIKISFENNYKSDEAEALILWLPDAKIQLIGKDSDAGKD